MKRTISVSVATAVTASVLCVGADAYAAKTYSNCTQLNRHYPHGVGLKRAHDKTGGTPVRNFKRSNALYRANENSDRDGDGIACEKA